ncbi:MAG: type II toxin-antitoxin system HigB family toxin [Planctomycetota bacterium]
MRIISRRTLKDYWEKECAAKEGLLAWYAEVKQAKWLTPPDVKGRYPSVSILKDGRVVFNIGGNKYRLVVWINYKFGIVYIRFIGSHTAYDKIDAETI